MATASSCVCSPCRCVPASLQLLVLSSVSECVADLSSRVVVVVVFVVVVQLRIRVAEQYVDATFAPLHFARRVPPEVRLVCVVVDKGREVYTGHSHSRSLIGRHVRTDDELH